MSRLSRAKTPPAASQEQRPEFVPARVFEIELSQPLPTLSAYDEKTGQSYQRAYCMIRLHTQPLGMLEIQLPAGRGHPQDYAQLIWCKMQKQIVRHLQQDGLATPTQLTASGLPFDALPCCLQERAAFLEHAPFASVIVPTRDRAECLVNCLRSLRALDYPRYEIIIVDSASRSRATAELVRPMEREDARIHYIYSERPGTSLARNLGMMAAKGEILAFTDDDAVVDVHWLTELVRAFGRAERVVCVAGSVGPLRLDTPAQFWVEKYFRDLSDPEKAQRIFTRQCIESHKRSQHFLAAPLGASVNMATTAAFLRHIGGFDPAFGPGTPVHGAEDVEVFIQANMHGGTFVYEPMALVYHLHRSSVEELAAQLHHYGISYPGLLIKSNLLYPQLLFDCLKQEMYRMMERIQARSGAKTPPVVRKGWKGEREMSMYVLRQMFKGMLHGPFALFKSTVLLHNRRAVRSNRRATAPLWLSTTTPTISALMPSPDARSRASVEHTAQPELQLS